MTGFAYRDGVLGAEGVALTDIAAAVDTPFYAYSAARLRANYAEFHDALADLDPLICFAVKACPNIAVIATLAACGAGADVTSAGELDRARRAGIDPAKIIFSGVGKSEVEIAKALTLGIRQFNVESIPELRLISAVGARLGKTAPVALRVNPDIAVTTHHKIATGATGVKFGIDAAQLGEAMALTRALPGLSLRGFMAHIGSHLFDYEEFRAAFTRLAELVRHWRGQGFAIGHLDLGGGVGIPYDGESQAPFADYAAVVRDTVATLGCALAFEPGRRLTGDAGVLVAKILYDKIGETTRFLILDAGMNDLIRPAMYEARHSILPVKDCRTTAATRDAHPVSVVGPVCETSDLFGADYHVPGAEAGDLVAILQAGAYGAAMSSTYNGRSLIPEVLIDGDNFRIIRRRIDVAEQMGWENL